VGVRPPRSSGSTLPSLGEITDGDLATPVPALAESARLRELVSQHGSPLMVLDCARVRAQYRRLAAALPGVDLHFAIKALPHTAVIATLGGEDSYFDFSSRGELGLLAALGIPANRAINTHPIKQDRDIRESLQYGCETFVVDNAAELAKFAPHRDQVSLLLRIGFRSEDAEVDLAKKFGCAVEDAYPLLDLGKQLGLRIIGLSFHVGSQCGSPRAFVAAINDCRLLIERARLARLADIQVLDIGGGFPVAYAHPGSAGSGSAPDPRDRGAGPVPGGPGDRGDRDRDREGSARRFFLVLLGRRRIRFLQWPRLRPHGSLSAAGGLAERRRTPLERARRSDLRQHRHHRGRPLAARAADRRPACGIVDGGLYDGQRLRVQFDS
jgi:hypothetical protein